jgi:hypothetical protein
MSMRRWHTRSEAAARRRWQLRWGAVLLIAIGLAAGCPFTPRDAPEPGTPGVDPGCRTPVPFRDPTEPAVVKDNIVAALRKRGFDGPTIPNYERSLDSLFIYLPDPDSDAGAPGGCGGPFFANWGRSREVRFMLETLETGSAVPDSVEISVPGFTEEGGTGDPNLRRFRVQYVMTLRGIPETGGRRSECYGGTALWDFFDQPDSQIFWTLIRWEDLQPLSETARCQGTTYKGTLGMLRSFWGQCQ